MTRFGGICLALIVAVAGCTTSPKSKDPEPFPKEYESLKRFTEVYGLVLKHYVDEPNRVELVSGAITGIQESILSKKGALEGSFNVLEVRGNDYGELKVLNEAITYFSQTTDIEVGLLLNAAIGGMVKTLDGSSAYIQADMYREIYGGADARNKGDSTAYVNPEAYRNIVRSGGVGLQISKKNEKIVVNFPITGSPAEKAGIKAGDHLVKINGEAIDSLTLLETIHRLRGPLGTDVNLTFRRDGVKEPVVFNLVRQEITIQDIYAKVIDPDIGYIRVTQFREGSAKELDRTIKMLQARQIKGLILDLRNNPGGLLTAAIDVSEQFVGLNRLIVYLKTREGRKVDYVSHIKEQPEDYPMIVLVNKGSASASEIVAGALQDWSRATIIGTETFGNGRIQTIIPLTDGSGLRLSTAKSFTPKGRPIESKIQPDVLIEEKEGEDNILVIAQEKLKSILKIN